jgi:predicted DNA-binding protein (MmcQ/YjbR family)
MIDTKTVRKLALSFDEAEEAPHFEKAAFRVRKKIFATLDNKRNQVILKLSPIDQSVFCSYKKDVIYPVPGAWGKLGWTVINMKKVRKDMFTDALTTAYCTVAPKKLAVKYTPEDPTN